MIFDSGEDVLLAFCLVNRLALCVACRPLPLTLRRRRRLQSTSYGFCRLDSAARKCSTDSLQGA